MDDTIKSSNSNSNFSIENFFFQNYWGGGEAEAPQPPPAPRSLLTKIHNPIQLEDLSFRAVKALQNEYHLLYRLFPSAYR